MTNNEVTKIVFISTRWIDECSVLGNEKYDEHLVFSESMKDFFLGLGDEDECAQFLKKIAKANSASGLTVQKAKQQLISIISENEEYSKLEFTDPSNKKKGRQLLSVLLKGVNDNDYDRFIHLIDDLKGEFVELADILVKYTPTGDCSVYKYDTQEILNTDFTSTGKDCSHMDKPKGGKQVKHRLGIYTVVDKQYAFCAIWPWSGDKKEEHDQRWCTAICNSIIEFYPNAKDVILLLHDRDFIAYDGENRPIGGFEYKSESKSFKYHLAVFQHSNRRIEGIIKNNPVKEIFDKMEKDAQGYYKKQNADAVNKIAEAYMSFLSCDDNSLPESR